MMQFYVILFSFKRLLTKTNVEAKLFVIFVIVMETKVWASTVQKENQGEIITILESIQIILTSSLVTNIK